MIFYTLTAFLNRFRNYKQKLNWIVLIVVYLRSFIMWFRKTEFRTFSDTLFYNKKIAKQPWINERSIEYAWIYQQILKIDHKKVLDVGANQELPSTQMLLENDNEVHLIDINADQENENNSNIIFFKGDIRNSPYNDAFFDAVIAVSTLEHIGISGRYGIADSDETGDFEALQEIYRILKPGGKFVFTVPYGLGQSLPLNRLYNLQRIENLLVKFQNHKKPVLSIRYFIQSLAGGFRKISST